MMRSKIIKESEIDNELTDALESFGYKVTISPYSNEERTYKYRVFLKEKPITHTEIFLIVRLYSRPF